MFMVDSSTLPLALFGIAFYFLSSFKIVMSIAKINYAEKESDIDVNYIRFVSFLVRTIIIGAMIWFIVSPYLSEKMRLPLLSCAILFTVVARLIYFSKGQASVK